MTVKLRLARFGRRNAAFYNIVVAHARYVVGMLPQATSRCLTLPHAATSCFPRELERPGLTPSSRTRRDGRPLEVIGTYDPTPKMDPYQTGGKPHKDIQLDLVRARYWIGVGAQPTDVVWRLLSMV